MGRSTRARREAIQGEGTINGGQEEKRRTLTLVAVGGAQVVGLDMLEWQQGAREGKREDVQVAAHGLLCVVCWCCLVKPWRVGDAIYCSDFEGCQRGWEGCVWSGECGVHDPFRIVFCGARKQGKASRKRRDVWCRDDEAVRTKRGGNGRAVKHDPAHMGLALRRSVGRSNGLEKSSATEKHNNKQKKTNTTCKESKPKAAAALGDFLSSGSEPAAARLTSPSVLVITTKISSCRHITTRSTANSLKKGLCNP